MTAADGNAEHRGHRRRQRRTRQPQPHGEHENVVEHHIEQAAAQRRHHGKGGVAIVADKGRHDVVAHKKRREHEEDAGIAGAQRHDLCIAAHEPQQPIRGKKTHQQKGDAQHAGTKHSIGEIALAAPVALRLQDGVTGGRAKADHGADGKDKVVHRQAEVEQGDAVGARRL